MEIIKGRVKKGRGLGKVMGFPTLNIGYEGETQGVFAGRIKFEIDRTSYDLKGAVHIGPRPTIDDAENICEVFVLNFPEELKDQSFENILIEVSLVQKIREVEKFESIDVLTEQIAKDVAQIKTII